jgi:hypothetical protein
MVCAGYYLYLLRIILLTLQIRKQLIFLQMSLIDCSSKCSLLITFRVPLVLCAMFTAMEIQVFFVLVTLHVLLFAR